jgi:hypothetical protein
MSKAREKAIPSFRCSFLGGRYTDETGDWEVVISKPVSFRGGKSVRARVQVPGQPASEREAVWQAHERIMVRRT